MDYMISIDDIYDKLQFYKTRIENISNIINAMEKLSHELEWEGEAYTLFINNYLTYIDGLKDYRDGLLHYSKILASFYSKYNDFYDEMEKEFETLLGEMEEDYEYHFL